MIRFLASAVLVVLVLQAPAAFAQTPNAGMRPALSGTATWDNPDPLPESATFSATVQDVSRLDREPELVGRIRMHPVPEQPLRFAIPYDPALVKPGHRYSLVARIDADGKPLFVTPGPVPVLVDGNPAAVDLMLAKSAGIAAAPLPPPSAPRLSGPTVLAPAGNTASVPSTGFPGGLPARFEGVLPCADCSGIRYELALSADGSYTLVRQYLGKPGEPAFTEQGVWRYDPAAETLTLPGDPDRTTAFTTAETGYLRLLDVEGKPIDSALNYRLARVRNAAPAGQSGAPVRLGPPTGDETPPTASAAPAGPRPLLDTSWRLMAIGDQTVAPEPGRRMPQLQLSSDLSVFAGNDGCNGIRGEYALADRDLSFSLGLSTNMACPGSAELAGAFLERLQRTATWGVTGDHLTLYDAYGTALMRFTAREPG